MYKNSNYKGNILPYQMSKLTCEELPNFTNGMTKHYHNRLYTIYNKWDKRVSFCVNRNTICQISEVEFHEWVDVAKLGELIIVVVKEKIKGVGFTLENAKKAVSQIIEIAKKQPSFLAKERVLVNEVSRYLTKSGFTMP